MTSPSTPSRSRYSGLPKPDSAEGVGEWARKIKALQQQVDADEEAEHKRLQDEIAASRIARKRRSRGVASPTNLEFASSRESLPGVTDKPSTSVADRQQSQAEAFQKLSGSSSTHPPDAVNSIASARAWMSSASTSATASKPSGPISLAAFMGGRATGPVLNKHAPQQDAHDPTQFNQERTRITAPHPVFGKGGVAMPGMAATNRFPRKDANGSTPPVVSPKYGNGRTGVTSTLPTAIPSNSFPATSSRGRSGSPTKQVDERPISPQKTGGRGRTTSTPSGTNGPSPEDRSASPHKNGARERTFSNPSPSFPLAAPVPSVEVRPLSPQKTGRRDRTISTPGKVTFSVSGSDDSPIKRPVSTSFSPPSKTPAQAPSFPPSKSPVVTPSLAKSIRPEPKPSPQGPQITLPNNTSPAFLKPPVQKEPTPSLSRLQGRGFVSNMVKASQSPPSSTQTTPDRSVPGARKATVLDRWQPRGASPSPTSPPPVAASPKPPVMRKSWTVDPTPSLKPAAVESPKPSRTLPLMSKDDSDPIHPRRDSQPMLNPQGTGLGSATTLVVFKPTTDEEELDSFGDVSELGVKRSSAATTMPSQQKLPVATGQPLNHPTKERARKPKKSRGPGGVKDEGSSASALSEPRNPVPQPRVEPSLATVTPPDPESPTRAEPPRPSLISRSSSGSGNVGRITDRWAEQAIIGVRPVGSSHQSSEPEPPKSSGMAGRRALPGLASSTPTPPNNNAPGVPRAFQVTHSEPPEKMVVSPSPPSKYPFEPTRPTTPNRHSRIPSTGNRPTVMDVAQAFADPDIHSPTAAEESPESEEEPEPLPMLKPTLRQNIIPPAFAEKRRSSYNEKYSALVLPPLKEEATPTPTPAGTLARGISPVVQAEIEQRQSVQDVFDHKSVRTASEISDVVQINHDDPPLPKINIDALLRAHQPSTSNTIADATTISVEVMIISGNNATAISRDPEIFYDAEVLAVIHRSKSKSTGLVSTAVWGWFGKNSQVSELERSKLEELSKRYGTTLIVVNQYEEPLDMLHVLGNKFAVRQGKRAHWSADNTAMHVVRSRKGVVFIDELDLNVRNLCSGFSYCLTVLESIYVWYGRGSLEAERKAALAYGRSLGADIVELEEGQDDGAEMFWMILGEDAFANANYWQWRPSAADAAPRVWVVSEPEVKPIEFMNVKDASTAVQVLDCLYEFFVVVGSQARAQRQNIRLALHVASELVKRVAVQKPYAPSIHVVVLPSQVPLDLKLHFRELDESLVNLKDVPDHMNLLSLNEAQDHLQRTSWEKFSLRDPLMLPLGIDPQLL